MNNESHQHEIDSIRSRYARREASDTYNRYDPILDVNISFRHERERALVGLLRPWLGGRVLADLDILEIGCGGGGNLLEFLTLGADPSRLVANELIPTRIAVAKSRLPESVRFIEGDAVASSIPPASADLVAQMVVFSSILDLNVRQALADKMWSLLRPGGAVLWYDFVFNNPRNPDVRSVDVKEIRRLFPAGDLVWKRVTLAPPLARAVSDVHPWLYGALNTLPFLRTHVIGLIRKH